MASLNYNKVIICGHLTADPDCRQTQNGTPVASFRVAVNRKYSGAGQQQADFFPIVAWDKKAQFVSQYFRKGTPIFVEGRLQEREWTDQQGDKRKIIEIIAEDVNFVESKTAASDTSTTEPKYVDVSSDDDLPF